MVTCFAEDYQAEVAGTGLIETESAHWTFVARGTRPPPPVPKSRYVRGRRVRVRAK